MLKSVNKLDGATVRASDGDIGSVKEAFFDDQAWAIRYLVVDTGSWLSGRRVLISPYAVSRAASDGDFIDVTLTREQVRNSPDVDTHQPVSRRMEREMSRYYAYPDYWDGTAMWAMTPLPMLPMPEAALRGNESARERDEAAVPAADVHLRSSAAVTGYDIQASDESIGHVKDFIFDDESWAIRYVVVDTRNWWPGGKKVLVAHRWIDRIDWSEKKVYTSLTREQVKNSPEYDETATLDRGYEQRLHDAYDRPAYWR